MNPGAAEDRDAANTLRIFAFLWAAAHGYHEAKWSYWLSTPSDFALGAGVALVLLRPSSVRRLTLLATLQLLNLAQTLPYAPNHWLLVTFVNVALLAAVAGAARAGAGAVRPAAVWRRFAPASRAVVVVVYAWAVFHKLNADWFDPAVSCATALMDDWARLVPLPDSASLYAVMPWAAVAVEAAIPALLLSRRGRFAGLILAAAFHFALGVPRFFNFSAIMLALFLPFAPEGFATAATRWMTGDPRRARVREWANGKFGASMKHTAYAALALGVVAVVATSPWTHAGVEPRLVREVGSGARTSWSYLFQFFWFPYYLGAAFCFVAIRRRCEPDRRTGAELLRAPSYLLYVVPLIALLNGTLPYVGLKTEGAFAMFSNLRTEGEHPNHYLVGGRLDPFGYQADLVRIEASGDPELAKLADRELSIPMYQLRYYLGKKRAEDAGPIDLTYERSGLVVTTRDVSTDPALQVRHGPLASKLLAFRPVEASGPVRCRH